MKVKKLFLKLGLVISFMLCFAQLCEAKVKLPVLISDGMVLQREQNITVWGHADAGEEVTVTFRKKTYKATADTEGKWSIVLPPMKAGGPYTMTVNDIQIKDILIGDVWLCSGQSNMELPISRVTDRYLDEIKSYENTNIRHVKVPLTYNFHNPQTDIPEVIWKPATQEHVMSFAALPYFYAKEMYEKNKIPVGLINSSVGGSPIEAWLSEEALKPFPKYINQKRIFENDNYIADLKKVENEQRKIWNSILYSADAGLHEPVKWFEARYDDSAWKSTTLFDTSWNNNGLNAINGSFWFRRNINVPRELAGKDAVLRLGCIVDADSVYVNGTFVGTVAYQYPPRIYNVPASLLKAGENNITVRLISYGGRARFVEEKPYKLIIGNEEISLLGEWKYRQGTPMPPMSGGTTLQYQPTGLYNAMIAPLEHYVFKGALWYQGESNTGRYNEYYDLLTALIADWRALLNTPDLPFVIIGLPNFGRPTDTYMQNQWAAFRAEQQRVANDVPNTGYVNAEDLGEWNDIHPLDKKDLAIRVAAVMRKLVGN